MNAGRGLALLVTLLLIIAGGTAFFRHVEAWSWLERDEFCLNRLGSYPLPGRQPRIAPDPAPQGGRDCAHPRCRARSSRQCGGSITSHHALDAHFFDVVTLSTVGYGSLVPVKAAGKVGTTVMIFLGLGVFALVIQQIAAYAATRRLRHRRAPGAARAGRPDTGGKPGS